MIAESPEFIRGEYVNWKIERLQIKTPKLEISSFEYDGTTHTVNILPQLESDSKPDPTNTTWVNISGTSATDAGSYTVTLSLKDKVNTQWWRVPSYSQNVPDALSDVNLTWQITPVYSEKPSAPTEYTYTGSKINLQVTGYDANIMDVTGKTSATNVRDTPATATYSLKDKNNYCWSDGSTGDVEITWQINRAKIPAVNHNLYQANTLIYNGSVQQVQIANFNDTYHVKIGGYDGYHYGLTAAGSYVVGIQPESNYCWSDGSTDTKSVNWTIGKATHNYTLPTGFVSSFSLTKQGAGNFSIATDDSDICAVKVEDSTFTLSQGKNGSAYITITQESDNNYLEFSARFQVTIARSLADFSWNQIAQFAKAGNLLDYCSIGDVKEVFVDGSALNSTIYGNFGVVLIGFNHNANYEGSNRAHFMIGKNGTRDIAFIGSDYDSADDEDSFFNRHWIKAIDRWPKRCDTLLSILPADLQSVITACKKDNGSFKFFLLHTKEIDGINFGSNFSRVEQYEYFKNGNGLKRMAHSGYNFVYWWTRTVSSATSTSPAQYYAATDTNMFNAIDYNYSLGIVPCFTIS